MGLIITTEDFESGKFTISTNKYTTTDINDYIDIFERNYLEDLLGVDLANLFIADLVNGEPQTPIYQDIFNRLSFDSDCWVKRSEGIKSMLQAFIWCEYVKDDNVRHTISGTVENNQEVSRLVSFRNAQFTERYNFAINTYNVIQLYILANEVDYPDYNGQTKKRKTII